MSGGRHGTTATRVLKVEGRTCSDAGASGQEGRGGHIEAAASWGCVARAL